MMPPRLLLGCSIWLFVLALCGCQRHQPPADPAPAACAPATEAGEISPRRVH